MNLLRKFPILPALAGQILAYFLVIRLSGLMELPAPAWWLLHGIAAAAVVAALRLPWWWMVIQVVAPITTALALSLDIPPWTYGLALILAALVFGGGWATRVPLYLSDGAAHRALISLLDGCPAPVAVDLGAGFGGPMRALAEAYGNGRFISVEASPATCLVAWLLARGRANLRVRWGDLWRQDLSGADLVYVFLSPQPMPRLWSEFITRGKSGALLVSNTFPVPGQTAERIIDLPGRADARLYIYRHP